MLGDFQIAQEMCLFMWFYCFIYLFFSKYEYKKEISHFVGKCCEVRFERITSVNITEWLLEIPNVPNNIAYLRLKR